MENNEFSTVDNNPGMPLGWKDAQAIYFWATDNGRGDAGGLGDISDAEVSLREVLEFSAPHIFHPRAENFVGTMEGKNWEETVARIKEINSEPRWSDERREKIWEKVGDELYFNSMDENTAMTDFYHAGVRKSEGEPMIDGLSKRDVLQQRTQMIRDFIATRKPGEKEYRIGEDAGVIGTQDYGHSFVDVVINPDEYFENGEQTIQELMTQAEVLDHYAEQDGLHVIAGDMYDDPTVIELEGENAEEIYDRVETGELANLEEIAQEYDIDGVEVQAGGATVTPTETPTEAAG